MSPLVRHRSGAASTAACRKWRVYPAGRLLDPVTSGSDAGSGVEFLASRGANAPGRRRTANTKYHRTSDDAVMILRRNMTWLAVFVVQLFFRNALQLLVLLGFGSSAAVLSAQSIEIKIVNGRDGRPMAGTCVDVWVGTERKTAMAIPADENGVARFRLTDNDGEVDIHNRWRNCGEFGLIDPVVKYNDSFRIYVGYVLVNHELPATPG
jgi:hypothetical protein